MAKEGRTFTTLEKSMTEKQLKKFCSKVIKEYANSECNFSTSYFVEHENITRSCFRSLLEMAVIENLVTEKELNKMQQKSIENQKSHAETTGRNTLVYYYRLKVQRNDYIVNCYPKDDIKDVAEEFANNLEITKQILADKNDVSVKIIDRLLVRAWIENIIDDETCKKIEKRSLSINSSLNTKEFFKELWSKRNSKEETFN